MLYHSVGRQLPIFNRKLVVAVLIIAAAGMGFGAAVMLLLGHSAVL
jgi:hypothetical protein